MRALIIGCGYVGLAVGAELARQGLEVFGLRRTESARSDLESAGIKPLVDDITRPEDLARLPGPFDWIVNTASSGRGGLEEYRKIYFEGARCVMEWLRTAPPQKYVYTSSTGVYAQDDGSWVTELSPTEPTSFTGKVLVETEKLLLGAWREHTIPIVILRVAGIYGPGRGYAFMQFVNNQPQLETGGERVMNMIHRDDVAGAIIAALKHGQPGEIFNAVDDEPVTQRDYYLWLSQALNKPMPAEEPRAGTLGPPAAGRDASPYQTLASTKRAATNKRISNKKLKTELGYRLRYPTFREGYAAEIRKLLGENTGPSAF